MNIHSASINNLRSNLTAAGIFASYKVNGSRLEVRLRDEDSYPDLCEIVARETESNYVLTVRFDKREIYPN